MNCCSCAHKLHEPIQFKIGLPGSPTNGTSLYNNEDIKYLKYLISKNGYGHLLENTDYERLPNGGFKLLEGAQFSTSEIYTITFYN